MFEDVRGNTGFLSCDFFPREGKKFHFRSLDWEESERASFHESPSFTRDDHSRHEYTLLDFPFRISPRRNSSEFSDSNEPRAKSLHDGGG